MKIFHRIFVNFANALIARASRRAPDFIIGGTSNPYLLRWWLIPRNPVFNIYLHKFLRDDDDRALHDHPWLWCSVLLRGDYIEVTAPPFEIDCHEGYIRFRNRLPKAAWVNCEYAMGGDDVRVIMRRRFASGTVRIHRAKFPHRIELLPWWQGSCETELPRFDKGCDLNVRAPAWTLFITGPRIRNWGFHCPGRGWVPWQKFTAADDAGAIGKGCDA